MRICFKEGTDINPGGDTCKGWEVPPGEKDKLDPLHHLPWAYTDSVSVFSREREVEFQNNLGVI